MTAFAHKALCSTCNEIALVHSSLSLVLVNAAEKAKDNTVLSVYR